MSFLSVKVVFGKTIFFLVFIYHYCWVFILGLGPAVFSASFYTICTTTLVLVSYLSFAYDIVIFTNKSRLSLTQLLDFLHHYEAILE